MARSRRDPVTSLLTDLPAFTRLGGGVFMVVDGPDRGEAVALADAPVIFGSSPSCTLPLTDKSVSRKHLQATYEEGGVVLRDLGSTNGSFLHGSRFKEITISYGTSFKLGRTIIKFVPEEEEVQPEISKSSSFGRLKGDDPKIRRLFGLLKDIAATEATVIVEGETGTGKELVAEEIHRHSPRARGPFVVFDCGAVPRDLIESALFGHIKGSFTGAVSDRKGAFTEANGGTIFLDEIGELSPDLQPSLLRVLDKRAVRPVGGNKYEKVDARVVVATNRDLREEVAKKNFREDLYYRLAVIRISLPPLRERGQDIPYLAKHFIKVFSPPGAELNITDEGLKKLQFHNWPGNVRELRNVIERACVLSKGDTVNLDDAFMDQDAPPALGIRTDLPFKEAKGRLVETFEREYIEDLMSRHKMNLSSAAREAQIDRKHLRELIRKYDLNGRD